MITRTNHNQAIDRKLLQSKNILTAHKQMIIALERHMDDCKDCTAEAICEVAMRLFRGMMAIDSLLDIVDALNAGVAHDITILKESIKMDRLAAPLARMPESMQ